ncbi:hypothetical protein [Chryseobacterium jejuense]|uniref:hypothetical protein n=1 Tax=Chryseobacterium jejuense TaxID=445960 RepID=UPI001AE9C428|nr:hypothetical protein [Chryseobacterium jejuense]MBP2619240.1 hypothetical protein [Chryseobacterium jejuense]
MKEVSKHIGFSPLQGSWFGFSSLENARPATVISILRQLILYIHALLIIPMLYGIRSIYMVSPIIE